MRSANVNGGAPASNVMKDGSGNTELVVFAQWCGFEQNFLQMRLRVSKRHEEYRMDQVGAISPCEMPDHLLKKIFYRTTLSQRA